MKKFLGVILILFVFQVLTAQEKKKIEAVRISEKVTVDGMLDESFWSNIPIATDFVQLDPDNGEPSNYKTEVKFAYDNKALYVGAVLYDPAPEIINKNLSKRDDLENNDFFDIILDPFNNGLDGYELIVSPVNVQLDAKFTNFEDFSWDAVWKSGVKIHDKGWTVEMEIPYSAIRFPDKPVQEWGVNIVRNIQRDREKVTWNFVDKKVSGFLNQSGVLTGIKDLKPPLRLSFTPYTSIYFNKKTNESWDTNVKGGLDMKLGINESFTLDMMLIPDFGQVESDDEVLNLSPFEIQFDEKRQFFTEASEIFERGNIFYSRRIGTLPKGYADVDDGLNINEEVNENPLKTKIINATKISGRTPKGLGIGFLNAMTQKSFAKVLDTITNESRKILTQPFTNYNILVLDQSLKNESFISLFNSNLYIPKNKYMANVSGTEMYFKNKSKTYGLGANAALSHKNHETEEDKTGFKYELEFEKIKGEIKYGLEHAIISDQYDQNDLGFLRRNNLINNEVWMAYNMSKPKGKFLRKRAWLGISNELLYKPSRFSNIQVHFESGFTFKSQNYFGFFSSSRPVKGNDYYEPRVEGLKYERPSSFEIGGWYGTDHRKDLSVEIIAAREWAFSSYDQNNYFFEIVPRYRFSDKFSLSYQLEVLLKKNDIGYANSETVNNKEVVYFGKRNRNIFENLLRADYIFNSKMYLSLRARHYWSNVEYENFFTLQNDGRLNESNYSENHDLNYNNFNIDMAFTWRFAPGSDLSVVWKSAINTSEETVEKNFFRNFKNTFDADQFNSLSFRIIYYLDYLSLRKKS